MKSGILTVITIMIFSGLQSQHISMSLGAQKTPFYTRDNFPSLSGGLEYEHTVLPRLSLSTGIVYSLFMRFSQTEDCYSPLGPCPAGYRGPLRIVEVPLLARFRLISTKEDISSLNILSGYGYGITRGTFEEVEYPDGAHSDGKIVTRELENIHIFSAGLEFRHYFSKRISFSLEARYRYLTEISNSEFENSDLNHILYSLRFGVDLRKKD
jgi:hypothetical protein